MESSDNYNFSIFRPRNKHGIKNRNVILSMLLIWAVAVFGFQVLLRLIEKPVPEKSLIAYESLWPAIRKGELSSSDTGVFLKTLLNARGKGTLNAGEQKILSEAISCFTSTILPENINSQVFEMVKEVGELKKAIQTQKDQEFLDTKLKVADLSEKIITVTIPYTGLVKGSLEASIFANSLRSEYPLSMNDSAFDQLDDIMKLYMTHNRSVLTDTKFLGFPFHYFYTAVFLLILFISLCIAFNKIIEWRLKQQNVVE